MKLAAMLFGLIQLVGASAGAYCGSPCTYDSECAGSSCAKCTSNQGPVNGNPTGICYQADV